MHHLLFNFESIAKFMKNSMDLQLHYPIWKMLKAYYMWGKKPPETVLYNTPINNTFIFYISKVN